MTFDKTASITDMITKSKEDQIKLSSLFDTPKGTKILWDGPDLFGKNTVHYRFANDSEVKIVDEDFEPVYYDEKGNEINKDGEKVDDSGTEKEVGYEVSVKNTKDKDNSVMNIKNVGDINICIKIVSEK